LVGINAGNVVCYWGFHIGYAWGIFSILDLVKMLGIVSVLGKLELGVLGTWEGDLLAALLWIRIFVAPTIVIFLLGRAVLDLVVCITAIEAKVVGSLVRSNFLIQVMEKGDIGLLMPEFGIVRVFIIKMKLRLE
jgi:hypothetical protein